MRHDPGPWQWPKVIRRGVGLGLAFVAVWGMALTADTGAVSAAFTQWMDQPAQVVGLLANQMGQPPQAQSPASLDGWGQLLVGQSALLSAAQEEIERLSRQEEDEEQPAPLEQDDDDESKPSLQPPEELDDVIEMTGVGQNGSQYLHRDQVYLYNRTGKSLTDAVFDQGEVNLSQQDGPQILILHSHGSEAYSQNDGNLYQETDPFRTTDCTKNVVRVGEEIAQVFRSYGLQVLHDTNVYDYPSYNEAYTRSKQAVEDWLAKYPSIQVILDVHRDALVGTDGSIYKLITEEEGQKVAQVMLVVGTDDGGADHPNWDDNLALGLTLQKALTEDYNALARPLVLRSSSYNQQLSPGFLLLEVGGHGNTLTEAVAGARMFADTAAQTLLGLMSGK